MVPTEYEEQVAFRKYLDLRGLPYFRVPNETSVKKYNPTTRKWGGGWEQNRRNAALGVKPGVPDMFVLVNSRVVAIEMKRAKKKGVKWSGASPNQRYWLDILAKHGVPSVICAGADEAIDFIENLLPDSAKKGDIMYRPSQAAEDSSSF